jgi:hypothetical protein
MNAGTGITLGDIFGGLNLLAIIAAAAKGGQMYGRVVTKQDTHGETLKEIITTLGNGAPGTVVRVPTCERLHAAVKDELVVVRDDIRELRELVIGK